MKQGRFRFFASLLVDQEMEGAPEQVKRLFLQTFSSTNLLPFDDEMERLAKAYLRHGVVSFTYEDGAGHVAACVVARLDYLVSWNFRHLVNVDRNDTFNLKIPRSLLRGTIFG